MARRTQVTARQERLGAELRKLREAAGLKGREAASLLGTDAGRLSQIESGVAGVSEETVRRLVAHYACTDAALIEALVAMATERVRGWWEEYRGLLPSAFLDLAELEHHATYRADVECLHIPGLLQTEEYARAVFAYRIPELPSEELELRVRHRMGRKAIIERPEPVPYEAVIHEAALRIRPVTGPPPAPTHLRPGTVRGGPCQRAGDPVRSGRLRRSLEHHDADGRPCPQAGLRTARRPRRNRPRRLRGATQLPPPALP